MDDTLMEAQELLIELELIRGILAKNNVYINSAKVLEVMDTKDIRNPYDAILDLYGINASKYFPKLKKSF